MRMQTLLGVLVVAIVSLSSKFVLAENCSPSDLKRFHNHKIDYDERGELATCLVHGYAQNNEVMASILNSLRDSNEHVFVREDIAEAFATMRWRHKVQVHESPAPENISQQDDDAMNRTVASAKGILDVTRAVKSMQEEMPITKFEGEIIRVLSEIALNRDTHVELRMTVVRALTQITKAEMDSGIFDEKTLRLAYETLKESSQQETNTIYYSGAHAAMEALVSDDKNAILASLDRPTRTISSVNH